MSDENGSTLLQSTLEQLRLEGALFFRSELREAFAFESEPLALVDALVPGADRLILFHIVARGSCWVTTADGVRHWADEGDVVVMPYGDEYTMGGRTTAEPVSILSLLDPLPWADIPVLRHGGDGDLTEMVCGYLHSEDPLFDPALRALPPVFVVRLPPGPAANWVQASIKYALEEGVPPSNRSPNVVSTRLPELVLIEVFARASRVGAGRRSRVARGAARSGARARVVVLARRAGAQVDRGRACCRRGGVAVAAR